MGASNCACGGLLYQVWDISGPSHYSEHDTPTVDVWLCDSCQAIHRRCVICTRYDMTGDHDEYETSWSRMDRSDFLTLLGVERPYNPGDPLTASLRVEWQVSPEFPMRLDYDLCVFVDETLVGRAARCQPGALCVVRCKAPAGAHLIRLEPFLWFRSQDAKRLPRPAAHGLRWTSRTSFEEGACLTLRLRSALLNRKPRWPFATSEWVMTSADESGQ